MFFQSKNLNSAFFYTILLLLFDHINYCWWGPKSFTTSNSRTVIVKHVIIFDLSEVKYTMYKMLVREKLKINS